MINKKTIAVCLTLDIIKKLKNKAKKLGISVSSLLEQILREASNL